MFAKLTSAFPRLVACPSQSSFSHAHVPHVISASCFYYARLFVDRLISAFFLHVRTRRCRKETNVSPRISSLVDGSIRLPVLSNFKTSMLTRPRKKANSSNATIRLVRVYLTRLIPTLQPHNLREDLLTLKPPYFHRSLHPYATLDLLLLVSTSIPAILFLNSRPIVTRSPIEGPIGCK